MSDETAPAATQTPETPAPAQAETPAPIQAEAPVEEKAPEIPVPVKEEPKKTDRHSMILAKIAQKDREIRQREESVKKNLEQLQDLQQLPKLAKENPIAFLQKMGISYEDLTQKILQGTDPIEDLNAKYTTLKTQQEAAEAERIKRETEAKAQVEHNQRMVAAEHKINEVREELKNNPSHYEIILLKGDEGFKDVVDVIAQHLTDTGRMLSAKEACDLVEKYNEKEAETLLKASKIKQKYQTQVSPEKGVKPSENLPSSNPGKQSKTITNSANSVTRESKPSSEDERLQRALAMWNKRNK